MASSSPHLLLLLLISLSAAALLISPSHSAEATCASQKFKNNKHYANCTALSSLGSYLHYSYNASNSSLSVAYVASPSKSAGWIAWAINPTATKMVGSQAIVAYTLADGTPTVKTYNISSYSSIVPGKLAFDVWDVSAELIDGSLTIFASVKVPEKAESVNQVWQVGPGINKTNGWLMKHAFAPENLAAHGPLSLVSTSSTNATANTTAGGSNTTTTDDSGKSGAGLRIGDGGHVGLFSIFLLVLGTLVTF